MQNDEEGKGKEEKSTGRTKVRNGNLRCVLVVLIALVLTLTFVQLLPLALKWISTWKCFEGCTFWGITDNISDWFAFLDSFREHFVTIFLTVITWKLTIDIEERSQRDTKLQNLSTLIMNVPYMFCDEVRMFLRGKDVLDSYIHIGSGEGNYTLSFLMDSAFPTYFDVSVPKIELEVINKNTKKRIYESVELQRECCEIYGNQKIRLNINMPNDANKALDCIYMMDLSAPIDNPAVDTKCKVTITLNLKNVLYVKADGVENKPIGLKLCFDLQNAGYERKENKYAYKKLEVVKTRLERMESKE